nr:prolyl oligopeptidase family serine peptidase [Thermoleophilaceae bacterium]
MLRAIPPIALAAAVLCGATPAHADTVTGLVGTCTVKDAADNDPAAGGNQLPYKFCDDGVPAVGGTTPNVGAVDALAVPQKYDGFTGLPPLSPSPDAGSGFDPVTNRIALDADISIPDATANPPPPGGWPLVVMMHGCCSGSKASWKDTKVDGSGEKWHYNNAWFASRGYVVLTYTSRGFVDGSNRGSTGFAELDSRRHEINDYQSLACQIAGTADLDPGTAGVQSINPQKIVPTGGSYGGGFTWMALTDPTWDCATEGAGATNMRVVAAATKYGWTDLAQSLVPNGNERKTSQPGTDPATAFTKTPLGYPKRTIVAGLYAAGKTGVPPGSPHTTFPPKIDQGIACLSSTDPFAQNPACTQAAPGSIATVPDLLDEFITDRSAYYQQDFWTGLGNNSIAPVPVFSAGTFTDPLFPPQEHRRMAERLKAAAPNYPVQEYYGDYQHFVQNKAKEWGDVCGADRHVCTYTDYPGGDLNQTPPTIAREVGATTRLNRFLDAYADPSANPAEPQPALDVTASLQVCPQNAASLGARPDEPGPRFTEGSFAALAPNTLTVLAPGLQTTTSDAAPNNHAANADPVQNSLAQTNRGKCPVEQSPGGFASAGPGVATYDSAALTRNVTMVGTSSVTANFNVIGGGASPFQLNARVYDLAPDGTQTMVDRGTRTFTETAGPLTFDVHGNGWRFDKDHKIRIELAQDDDPYIKSSAVPSSIAFSGISISVPIREAPETIAGGAAPEAPGTAPGGAGGGDPGAPG